MGPVLWDWRGEEKSAWDALPVQGRGVVLFTNDKISSGWMKNPVRAGFKQRYYIAALQLRAKVYPTREALTRGRIKEWADCRRCGAPLESCSHILGQCPAVQSSRIERHNKLCALLAEEAEACGWKTLREPRISGPSGELRLPDMVLSKGSTALVIQQAGHSREPRISGPSPEERRAPPAGWDGEAGPPRDCGIPLCGDTFYWEVDLEITGWQARTLWPYDCEGCGCCPFRDQVRLHLERAQQNQKTWYEEAWTHEHGTAYIHLKDESPIRQRPYRVPERLLETLKMEIRTMLDIGVIEPSDSEWCSPIVTISKPDGSLRVCIDFRKINFELEHPHTVPADGAVGVEVEGHQAFWMCNNKPFISVLTTVPPHTDSLGVSTKAKAGLVTEDD
ncbi:hypothetical protein NFI96_005715 [Prochilodus magdalenae]|nr:hypothetical protein NFI96_005715 [Prochilodus magdalenae]